MKEIAVLGSSLSIRSDSLVCGVRAIIVGKIQWKLLKLTQGPYPSPVPDSLICWLLTRFRRGSGGCSRRSR